MKIVIINGVNLNLLGIRQPEVYGKQCFEEYLKHLRQKFPNLQIEYYQTNIEGEMVNILHQVGFEDCGIVLNAGAYTHTSIAIADAIRSITAPVVEVHISNTFAREEYRHHSYLSPVCKGVIVGFGLKSYELAIQSYL